MSELVDVGYVDPGDERDDIADPSPSAAELSDDPIAARGPSIAELGRDQLKRLLEFGSGIDQVLARQELERRAGAGYQPSLLSPAQRLAQTAPRRAR